MSRQDRPRVQFDFHVTQTPRDRDYVPPKARDDQRVALFEGGPQGIVIAHDQHVGSRAVAAAFNWAAHEGTEEDLASMARLFSYTSLGTAYHLYAQRAVHEVMYRKLPLPLAVDLETGEYASREEFVDMAASGLGAAADIAERIEAKTIEQKSTKKENIQLGRQLGSVGLILAAISGNATGQRGTKVEVQDFVYFTAHAALLEMIELSGKIGARPTVAQIPNPQSPLMVYLHNDRNSITDPGYSRLKASVQDSSSHESRSHA